MGNANFPCEVWEFSQKTSFRCHAFNLNDSGDRNRTYYTRFQSNEKYHWAIVPRSCHNHVKINHLDKNIQIKFFKNLISQVIFHKKSTINHVIVL